MKRGGMCAVADRAHPPEIRIARATRARPKLVADLFCGAGGLSTGATRAFRGLGMPFKLVGVNHWPVAIETNKRNHAEHADRIHCADLESARPIQLVPEGYLDLLMAAPACTFHSRARGGKPVNDQQRMDPWHVVRWCTELRVKRILVENVPEFMDWGPCSMVTGRPIPSRKGEYFRAWIEALRAVGFRVDWRVLCAADYGDATTRRRFILIGRSDGKPLRWPEPTYAAEPTTDLLGTRKRWRAAADIIDWQREGGSIFTRKKPLAPNTLRRILAGAERYGWPEPYVAALRALLDGRAPVLDVPADQAAPMLVHFRGTGAHALENTARPVEVPLPTLTAGGGHIGLVMATASGGAARDLAEPVPTIVGGGNGARPHFVEPLLMGVGANNAAKPTSQPLPTITTGGGSAAKHPGNARPQLIEPLIVNRCNSEGGRTARPTSEPFPTACTAGAGYLAEPLVAPYYGDGSGLTAAPASQPLPAITTRARFGVAQPFGLPVTHQGDVRTYDLQKPLPTVTGAARGELGLAAPILMRAGHGDSDGRNPASRLVNPLAPVPTLTGSNEMSMAMPVLIQTDQTGGNGAYVRSPAQPLGVIVTKRNTGLAEPFLVPHYGERTGQEPRTHDVAEPVPAITTANRFGLAVPAAGVRIDIRYRMLHWRELARATSFDHGDEVYDFAGTGTEITKQIGNAVPCKLGEALVEVLMEDAA